MPDTIDDERSGPDDVATVVEAPSLPRVKPSPPRMDTPRRYSRRDVLGIGGMGTVVECLDRRLGRVIAEKTLTDVESAKARWRFLREVQVQAQLEHPAIVPVYELDVTASGAPCFTMKRVQGVTLAAAIRAAGKGEVMPRFAPRRLLSALASVCLAVDYAHRRGVIHRDLKPSNVMLGAWGEVYVLDWGVARILDDDQADVDVSSAEIRALEDESEDDWRTYLAGTPGFIAPEVLMERSSGTPESDVYSLGAILFEILTGHSLHQGSPAARFESTRLGVDVRERVGELGAQVPPELLAVCARATAMVEERYPDARSMHDELQAYLDGNRDLALRRDMADDLARDALDRLDDDDAHDRQAVLRDLVAALALEPTHGDALRGLHRLLSEPPKELPPDVVQRLNDVEDERIVAVTRPALASAMVGMPLALGLGYVMGLRDHVFFFALAALTLALMTIVWVEGWRAARRTTQSSRAIRTGRRDVAPLTLMAIGIAAVSGVAGPFVLVPALAASLGIVRILRDGRQPWLVLGLMLGSIFVPLGLMLTGVLPAPYSFDEAGWLIRPLVVDLPAVPTMIWTSACAVVIVVFAGLVAVRYRRELDAAERRNELYLWQLGRLLPAPRPETDEDA